jgi:lipopolysaccharide/colanic/teichoic acid biosynthesis glycosyltransferase
VTREGIASPWVVRAAPLPGDSMRVAQDFVLAALMLLAVSPVLLLAALAIKIDSPGPVIYHARRAGLGGRPITVFKLRTMVVDADRRSPVTVGGDSRITRVGSWLRATKIDELPQLWNILRGEMAIVGPRPESLSIVEMYYDQYGMETLSIRPGLTCPGNLLYYVFHEKLAAPEGMDEATFYVGHLLTPKLLADLHYVRNRSITYDWRLIAQTLWTVGVKLLGMKPNWQPEFALTPPNDWQGQIWAAPRHMAGMPDCSALPTAREKRGRRRNVLRRHEGSCTDEPAVVVFKGDGKGES